MSEENGTKVPLSRDDENVAPVESKGKGKAVAADEEETVPVVDDDEMDDEEESGVEDTEGVSSAILLSPFVVMALGRFCSFPWSLC